MIMEKKRDEERKEKTKKNVFELGSDSSEEEVQKESSEEDAKVAEVLDEN